MPAGTPKVTIFGGVSLVPGGCQTFNAPGTFTVPTGVKKVNLVGKGAAGNAGNPGNTGNPGKGGNGGTGGTSYLYVWMGCGSYGFCGSQNGGSGGTGSPVNNPITSGNPGNAGSAGSASTGF